MKEGPKLNAFAIYTRIILYKQNENHFYLDPIKPEKNMNGKQLWFCWILHNKIVKTEKKSPSENINRSTDQSKYTQNTKRKDGSRQQKPPDTMYMTV